MGSRAQPVYVHPIAFVQNILPESPPPNEISNSHDLVVFRIRLRNPVYIQAVSSEVNVFCSVSTSIKVIITLDIMHTNPNAWSKTQSLRTGVHDGLTASKEAAIQHHAVIRDPMSPHPYFSYM